MITYDGYNLQFPTVTDHATYGKVVDYGKVVIHKAGYSLSVDVTNYKFLDNLKRSPSEEGIMLLQRMEQLHKDGMSWEMLRDYYEL